MVDPALASAPTPALSLALVPAVAPAPVLIVVPALAVAPAFALAPTPALAVTLAPRTHALVLKAWIARAAARARSHNRRSMNVDTTSLDIFRPALCRHSVSQKTSQLVVLESPRNVMGWMCSAISCRYCDKR